MNSASRPRARAPLARALSNKRLVLLAIGGAVLAVAFAYCLIAIQSVYISSVAAAVSFAAFEMSLLFCYAVFRSKSAALEDVQSGLLPQINVLGLRKRINAVNNERGFDLIVRNDGTRAGRELFRRRDLDQGYEIYQGARRADARYLLTLCSGIAADTCHTCRPWRRCFRFISSQAERDQTDTGLLATGWPAQSAADLFLGKFPASTGAGFRLW